MKVYFRIVPAILCIAASMISIPGCEYDVTQSKWYDPITEPPRPVITAMEPDTAKGGVNLITIVGENFAVYPDTNKIYFQNLASDPVQVSEVDPLEVTATRITVRRPNIASDSCVVMVSRRKDALVVAKSQPYTITQTHESYGTFIENIFLTAITVDAEENVYVTRIDSNIYKVSPGQSKVLITKAAQVPVDMKIGPDNRLYMIGTGGVSGNRNIFVCNPQTGEKHQWVTIMQGTAGKNVKFGEFDASGYFYVGGGNRIDIWIIAPDSTYTAANLYANNEVLAMKIFDNYLYVAAKTGSGASAVTEIYKHAIGANGTLGAAELVLNFTATPFGSRIFRGMAFSDEGLMYIATDFADLVDPLLVFDPVTNEIDYFYKDILPGFVRDINWGTGNFLYMITGKTDVQDWTVYKVDMGSPGSR